MRISTYMAVLALAATPLAASAEAPDGAGRPLADVLGEAARLKKPILLDFSTVW